MKLILTPDTISSNSVISKLAVDGAFECYILEPPNPIPAGTYEIKILDSRKFGRPMPHLLSVPGHEAIEIHWGNTSKDTRNCLLTGRTRGTDFVGESRLAFEALFAKLKDPISIQIIRGLATMEPIAPISNTAAVTVAVLGGALTRVGLHISQQKYGVDLSADQADLTMLAGGFLGYMSSHLNALGGWIVKKMSGTS
jgi:hypothetical protein